MAVHMINHIRKRRYKCNQCDKSFEYKCHLIVHMRNHTGERPYNCKQCGKSFKQNKQLTIHMGSHTGERPYNCNNCDKTFYHKSSFIVHKSYHCEERTYNCNHCDKSFKKKYYLEVHMRNHNGGNPYTCHICFESYKHKSALAVHIRNHNTYNCKQCDKSFRRKSDLAAHINIPHTGGVHPYQMSQLEKSYKFNVAHGVYNDKDINNHNLHNHKGNISASQENNGKFMAFACFICKAGFNNLNACRQHIKSHKKNMIPMFIKDESTYQINTPKNYSRNPTIENQLNIYVRQNDTSDHRDEISIKLEQDNNDDLKQVLENNGEECVMNPLKKIINSSNNDSIKTESKESIGQVSLKKEQDLFNNILKQEELDYDDVKVGDDGLLDALNLVKQEIKYNDVNSYKDTISL